MNERPPHSARVRIPMSGRSNRGGGNTDKPESAMANSRPTTAHAYPSRLSTGRPSTANSGSGKHTVTTQDRLFYNDTMRIYRPFSPRDPAHVDKPMPPILPPSRFPTVPQYEEEPTRKKKLSCPDAWVHESQKPDLFDKSNFAAKLDDATKIKYSRAFIERNRGDLWKYDHRYSKMTPRTVCQEILDDERNFIPIMTRNYSRERVLKLGSSAAAKDCLTYDLDPYERYGNTSYNDPFIASLTTSRQAKDKRMETMLLPATLNSDKSHCRGHAHAPEYGNFSRYNGVLKSNQAAVIDR